MSPDSLASANQLLRAHSLAAARIASWDVEHHELRLEVFHIDWPGQVFGVLRFSEVAYLQLPAETSWGYQLRVVTEASLPSRINEDYGERIYELFTADGAEPSAFIVAHDVDCIETGDRSQGARGHQV